MFLRKFAQVSDEPLYRLFIQQIAVGRHDRQVAGYQLFLRQQDAVAQVGFISFYLAAVGQLHRTVEHPGQRRRVA